MGTGMRLFVLSLFLAGGLFLSFSACNSEWHVSGRSTGILYSVSTINTVVGSELSIPAPALEKFTNPTFTVTPAFPEGISLSTTLGSISGRPKGSMALTEYVVTAKEAGRTATARISIAIEKWTAQAYLKASNSGTADVYGGSVAIDGDTIVVGAPTEDSNQRTITNGTSSSTDNSASNSGAVYIYRRNGTTWVQEAYLKAPNADATDYFGISVALSGGTLVVGASGEDSDATSVTNGTTASASNSATDSGAAYVFKRTGTTWAQEAYLKPSNTNAGDSFGESVSISGETIVVGASNEASNQTTVTNGSTASSNNSASSAGAVYVFQRSGSSWSQEAYLKASNSGAGDTFGFSVAISGDTIVVGSQGEDSNKTSITNGSTASNDDLASESGAAYIFQKTGSTWEQTAYLKAANAEIGDEFGSSVAIYGNTVLVGAVNEASNQTTITNGPTASSDNSMSQAGAVYVFRRSGATWAQEAYLKAPNMNAGDFFGYMVALWEDRAVVGAFLEDSNQTTITHGPEASGDNSASGAGAIYVFKRTNNSWVHEAYLKAPNAEASDDYGYAVAISEKTLVCGALQEDSDQTSITHGETASRSNAAAESGAAYIYRLDIP